MGGGWEYFFKIASEVRQRQWGNVYHTEHLYHQKSRDNRVKVALLCLIVILDQIKNSVEFKIMFYLEIY